MSATSGTFRRLASLYWPRVSSRVAGILNQEATITGLAGISRSRNMQFIPYGELRGFRALEERDPLQPHFDTCTVCGKIGLDSKFVIHNSLVLDTTIRPDFAQVESDEPQNTINQRFEVFFPEKRPFFLENANYFEAPLIGIGGTQDRMVFTRRIADPTAGQDACSSHLCLLHLFAGAMKSRKGEGK